MLHSTHVWGKNGQLDSEGNVVSGKLWATISYNDITQQLRETRDGKRWPTGYGDEFSYRDRDGASGGDYLARVRYYTDLGYLVLTEDNLPE